MARKNIDIQEECKGATLITDSYDSSLKSRNASSKTLLHPKHEEEGNTHTKPLSTARRVRILPQVNSLAAKKPGNSSRNPVSSRNDEANAKQKGRATPARTAKRTIAYRDAIDILSDSSDESVQEASTFRGDNSSEPESDSDASIDSPIAWPRARIEALSPKKTQLSSPPSKTVSRPPALDVARFGSVLVPMSLSKHIDSLCLSDKENDTENGVTQALKVPTACTPPASPSKTRLNSPSKPRTRIPTPPGRPSLDNFWDMGEVNDWNDKHSPRKLLASPSKHRFLYPEAFKHPALSSQSSSDAEPQTPSRKFPAKSLSRSPSKTSPTKSPVKSKAEIKARKDFDSIKEQLAIDFLAELDSTITQDRISTATASTGGVKIVWSNTLNSTAGRASWKREAIRPRTGREASTSSTSTSPSSQPPSLSTSTAHPPISEPAPDAAAAAAAEAAATVQYKHHATIELATKVLTTKSRLYNTLAHEFCHLCVYILDGVRDRPHGAEFKTWGRRCSKAFTDREVEVTTKHGYEIEFRYLWICTGDDMGKEGGEQGGRDGVLVFDEGCGREYGRHSKSIDPGKQRCGACKGRLVQVRPAPRGAVASVGVKGEKVSGAKVVGFAGFVKEEMARTRKEMEEGGKKVKHGEVMAELGRRWRAKKEKSLGQVDHERSVMIKGDAMVEKLLERIEVIRISDDDSA